MDLSSYTTASDIPQVREKNPLEDLIAEKQIFQIDSKETGTLFTTEKGEAYLFTEESLAAEFVKADEKKTYASLSMSTFEAFEWKCFCLGIKRIILDNNTEKMYPFHHPKSIREQANPKLTKVVNLLLESLQMKYLQELGKQTFIIPATTRTEVLNKTKELVMIRYMVVKANVKNQEDLPIYYVTFTDMDHYEAFRSKNSPYMPLEVSFWQLMQICGDSGIVINPKDPAELFLEPHLLKMIEYKLPDSMFLPVKASPQGQDPPALSRS